VKNTPCSARGVWYGGAIQSKYELFVGGGLWVCGGCEALIANTFT